PLLSGWVAMVEPRQGNTAGRTSTRAVYRAVGADYFAAIGTRIVRGRAINREDRTGAPPVAVVNEEFVRRVFGASNPIGEVVDFEGIHSTIVGHGSVTIVGIAADIKEIGPNEVSMADIYMPFAQRPAPIVELLVRGT